MELKETLGKDGETPEGKEEPESALKYRSAYGHRYLRYYIGISKGAVFYESNDADFSRFLRKAEKNGFKDRLHYR